MYGFSGQKSLLYAYGIRKTIFFISIINNFTSTICVPTISLLLRNILIL